jgi:zinc transport system substrate-binding protein
MEIVMRTFKSIVITLTVVLAGCGSNESGKVAPVAEETTDTLVIYTVNYPLAYFAERIGGDLAEVVFPAPVEEDPAFWSPDADTIAAYQTADLILLNGAGYARWVDRATLPSSRLIDTGAAFADRLIEMESVTTHSHGPEGEHEHGGWAFTTWLNPTLAIQQVQAVAAAITVLRPEHAKGIQARMEELESDLLNLDGRLSSAAKIIGDTPLVFSHPVYQYLIRRYELNGVEVHWEPDETPDGHAWDHLEKQLKSHPTEWMLWEGEPFQSTVADLEDLGIGSLLLDPCGNAPETGDYLTVMDANAGSLETIAETLNH